MHGKIIDHVVLIKEPVAEKHFALAVVTTGKHQLIPLYDFYLSKLPVSI
jgi:hypothetical protein